MNPPATDHPVQRPTATSRRAVRSPQPTLDRAAQRPQPAPRHAAQRPQPAPHRSGRRPGPALGHAVRARARRDGGSTTLEAVILVPALLAFAALIIFAGRVALAHQAVEQAAWDAAREASLARNPAEAQARATSRAADLLASLGCQPAVAVDTSGFAVPVSQPASVTAAVACTVDLSYLTVPGIPGSITLHAAADSPLDTYRGRR